MRFVSGVIVRLLRVVICVCVCARILGILKYIPHMVDCALRIRFKSLVASVCAKQNRARSDPMKGDGGGLVNRK